MASPPDIVRLRDIEGLGFRECAARLGLGSRHSARRAYTKARAGVTKAGRAPVTDAPRSLIRFARDKRREGCPVCALSPDIRAQLVEASSRKIPRAVQLEWLRTDVGARITDADLSQHANGRHDAEER